MGDVRSSFARVAANYSRSTFHTSSERLQEVLELAHPLKGDLALDVATGTGNTAFALAPHVRRVVGVDVTREMLDEARRTGVVKTMFGRRRLVPNLTSRNFQMRAQSEREAVNMPIQGTAAGILKRAMIELHAALPTQGLRTRMILTVHDELLFEAPREEADVAAALVRDRMEQVVTLDVPLTVDVGIADNWRDAKP